MRAAVRRQYGLDALRLEEVPRPGVADNEVLVRVRASSVNPADWYAITGPLAARLMNGMRKPKTPAVGTDFAGTVEAVGAAVTQFRAGDDVYGGRSGSFAEYVSVPEDRAIAPKPANLSFDEAASIPIAGVTAYQGLHDHARVRPGQHVLVNGASGGVGTFAVQIAKALGAEVTGVCSAANVERARSLGADRVVDYTREDFTRTRERYDVVLDVAGSRNWPDYRRVLKPEGTFVLVGAPRSRPLRHLVKTLVAAKLRGRQKARFFVAKPNRQSLETLRELIESGKVKPVIDRSYELVEIGEALRYLGDGHAQGKVVLRVP